MDEYKDVTHRCPDMIDKVAEQKEIDYQITIGKILSQKLTKLNKSSDYSKLKVYCEELIYENYRLEKKIRKFANDPHYKEKLDV